MGIYLEAEAEKVAETEMGHPGEKGDDERRKFVDRIRGTAQMEDGYSKNVKRLWGPL